MHDNVNDKNVAPPPTLELLLLSDNKGVLGSISIATATLTSLAKISQSFDDDG